MKTSKSKKPKTPSEDIDLLKSEVASFASSLGLSAPSSTTNGGFDDSDFRKTGPLKPHNSDKTPPSNKTKPEKFNKNNTKENPKNPKFKSNNKPHSKAQPQIDSNNDKDNLWKTVGKYKNLPKLPLVKASVLGAWHVDAAELEEKVIGKKKIEFKNAEEWKVLVEKKKELGERLMAQYVQDYETSRGQSGDIKMLISTQRSGTAADKVSAYSVLLGDNAVANMRSLDALLGMVTSKVGKRHSLTGFEALKELFVSSLLPDRKLKTLIQRPLNHLPESKDGNSLLLFWYWEECLKQRYERFVIALEEASRDVLAILKDKALKTVYMLLRSKSEQERRLLSALVNKLGDPANKAASNADYLLLKLLGDHPNMKAVVIDEVDNFLFRPHLVLKAKYHAVNFLTQIRLGHRGDGPKIAKRLIDVYFALFKVIISKATEEHMAEKNSKEEKKKSTSSKDKKENAPSESHFEMDSRLLSALLTGINRAFPFVSSDEADDIIEIQTPMLFQLVHSSNFNVGVQALMLLDKISAKNQIVSDRFYRALYAKVLLPAAMNSSKDEMFIGLLLRAMKNDINLKRVAAFAKRLLQVALQQPPQYACGCLFLLSEVLKARPPLWNMVLQNESVDEDLEHFEDIAEEEENQPAPTQKGTDNADEVISKTEGIRADSESSSDEGNPAASDSEDDEGSPAASDSEDDDMDESGNLLLGDGLDTLNESEPVTEDQEHVDEDQEQESEALNVKALLPGGYNPRHREPSFCNADLVGWWELTVLASHVHPSVATMAKTILSGANIVYNGNPLHDLSLSAFLDKFMEKKPKKATWHGGSQIEPAKKMDMNHHLIGPEILSLAEGDVAPEDLVFHKFYTNKMSSSKNPKKKKKKKQSEDEEDEDVEELLPVDGDEDESDNEEIEDILDSADPSLQEDGAYDYDDLDNIADEDDDDLIGNASDIEMDLPSDMLDGDLEDADDDPADIDDDEIAIGEADDGSDEEDEIVVGEADDGSDEEDNSIKSKRKRKQKIPKKAGASPFASLEDYEDLMNQDSPVEDTSTKKQKSKPKKKRKTSK